VTTTFDRTKTTVQASGVAALAHGPLAALAGAAVAGYEIHNGVTTAAPGTPPAFSLTRRGGVTTAVDDGAVNPAGNVFGTYLHGVFDTPDFRRAFLAALAAGSDLPVPSAGSGPDLEARFDRLASHVRAHLDLARVRRIAGLGD
jgi:adenosylcobyric acid synthase